MRSLGLPLTLAALLALAPAVSAGPIDAQIPVLASPTATSPGTITALAAVAPSAKTIDGDPSDWLGAATGFGGQTVRSRGELVYTDHLFDAFGPDDGRDAQRYSDTAALETVPPTYRLQAIYENDPAGEFGVPVPDETRYKTRYGDLDQQDRADLTELRLGADATDLYVLARTATMTAATDAGVLLLLDDGRAGPADATVPFGSGLRTSVGDLAVLLIGDRGWVADLHAGTTTALPAGTVATRPDGWDNAVEARLSRAALNLPAQVKVIAAAGRANATADGLANVANVAFRGAEPVREFFDFLQALSLHAGTIDGFQRAVDLDALAGGANERWTPGHGYYERVFRSSEQISRESGSDGILQPYGVYFPWAYDQEHPSPTPLQLWLHWRGGSAHAAAHTIPRLFKDLGDEHGTIVVSPRGRGSSSWYVGRGQVDLDEVWADVHQSFRIDASRRYVAGHSMGGWGSYLMTILHPDWFAAGLPASPPVTQGAWTGLDFEGCDDLVYDEYSPCYIQANDGDARTQHTRRLLENTRHVPLAIYAGVEDELVMYSGELRQVERLTELGYRFRFYSFLTQEHYGPPVWDQWQDAGDWMHLQRIPASPRRVTYRRDMPFERATERINSGGATLDFSFDGAYWVDGLEPVDPVDGVAAFDGRSLAIPEEEPLTIPTAGGPVSEGQTGPFVRAGMKWIDNPLTSPPAAQNAFTATLTGAKAVRLDMAKMRLSSSKRLTGTVTTDAPLTLTLVWPTQTVTRTLPAGTSTVVVG